MADAHSKQHDYHLVNPSPWPLAGSIAAFVLAVSTILWMHKSAGAWMPLVGLTLVLLVMIFWWRDVINEAHAGDHTPVVQLHLRYGMILFIASEVMFFVAWFWAYFDIALFPSSVGHWNNVTETMGQVTRNEVTGGVWPPKPTADGKTFVSNFDP